MLFERPSYPAVDDHPFWALCRRACTWHLFAPSLLLGCIESTDKPPQRYYAQGSSSTQWHESRVSRCCSPAGPVDPAAGTDASDRTALGGSSHSIISLFANARAPLLRFILCYQSIRLEIEGGTHHSGHYRNPAEPLLAMATDGLIPQVYNHKLQQNAITSRNGYRVCARLGAGCRAQM